MTKEEFESIFDMVKGNAITAIKYRTAEEIEGNAKALWLKFKDMDARDFLSLCCRWMDRSKDMPSRLNLQQILDSINCPLMEWLKERKLPKEYKPKDNWRRRKEIVAQGWRVLGQIKKAEAIEKELGESS